jgi:hypothetical protein
MHAVEAHDEYFVWKRNAATTARLTCFQKVTASFQMLTYEVPADVTDEYVRIAKSTTIENLRRLVNVIIEIFEDKYLRSPNEHDTA